MIVFELQRDLNFKRDIILNCIKKLTTNKHRKTNNVNGVKKQYLRDNLYKYL